MASGFGSFTSSTTVGNGATVNAVLSQSVDSTNRKVTVTLRMTAAYRRTASGSWTPGGGVAIWGSANASNYLNGNVGGTTGGLSGVNIGVSSLSGKTYTNGGVYTIPNGQIQVRSGYQGDKTISKTYNYDTSGSAITGTWSVEMYVPGIGSTKAKVSGSFTTDSITPAYTAPSGLSVSGVSTTWNSVTATSKVTSWGTGTGSNHLETLVLTQPYTQGGLPHQFISTTSSSQTVTVTNSNSTAANGGVTIKGAGDYYAGTYATNGALDARATSGVVYTPPSPLASIAYTQTQNSTNVTVGVTVTGGSSSNNNSNTVTTYYRYSTNGGSSYSGWTSIGTGTAWTAKTTSFNCNYGASVVIQAKQNYHGDSEVKQVSFTATNGTAPSGGSVSITSATWNSVTLSASNVDYGKPDGISGRKISIGVSGSSADLNYKRENQVENATSANTTVTNSSIYPGANALTLKGMLPVYAYLWAWNTVQSNTLVHSSTAYYLPPAPGTLTYTAPAQGQSTATVNYTGVASNNVTDYTAADLKRTVRYSVNGGAWVYEVNDVATAVDANTNFTITIPAQESAVVEAWMTYKGTTSSVSSTTIVNGNQPVHLYGSVNGTAKEIVHLYGSVNGARKKLTKLYGSQNGICKKIFEDLS